jgi:hypothetical protein
VCSFPKKTLVRGVGPSVGPRSRRTERQNPCGSSCAVTRRPSCAVLIGSVLSFQVVQLRTKRAGVWRACVRFHSPCPHACPCRVAEGRHGHVLKAWCDVSMPCVFLGPCICRPRCAWTAATSSEDPLATFLSLIVFSPWTVQPCTDELRTDGIHHTTRARGRLPPWQQALRCQGGASQAKETAYRSWPSPPTSFCEVHPTFRARHVLTVVWWMHALQTSTDTSNKPQQQASLHFLALPPPLLT